jgi:hypothetical protein
MCKAIAANCVSAKTGRMTLATQFTRLIVAIQKPSALVGPACWTNPSNARSIPEHINEAKPP